MIRILFQRRIIKETVLLLLKLVISCGLVVRKVRSYLIYMNEQTGKIHDPNCVLILAGLQFQP